MESAMDIVPNGGVYNGGEHLRQNLEGCSSAEARWVWNSAPGWGPRPLGIGTEGPPIISSDDPEQLGSTKEASPGSSAAKRKQNGDNEASNKIPKKKGPPKGTKYRKERGLRRGIKLDYNQKVVPMVGCKGVDDVIQIAKNNPLQPHQMFLTLDEAELRVFYHTSFCDKGPFKRKGRKGQDKRGFDCERENCGFEIQIKVSR
jgi:hypothetical protein